MKKTRDKRDLVVICVCSGILAVNLLMLLYAFTQRAYLPLKSKNLPIMYITYVSMVCWFLGSMYANQSSYFPLSWLICVSIYAWVRMSLGVFLFIGMFQLRVYHYITIFILQRRVLGRRLWLPVAYLCIISATYAVVAVALPQQYGFKYYASTDACVTQNVIYVVGYVLLGIQLVVTLGLSIKARKINACFNEFREIIIIIALACLAGIISACTRWIAHSSPSKAFWVEAIDTLALFFASEVNFVVILGPPLYHSVFNREEHLQYFIHRMKHCNLVKEYEMANNERSGAMNMSRQSQESTL
ncbi:hypothetical protein GGI12_005549, partial [Dipsacomyces acuminosporus]